MRSHAVSDQIYVRVVTYRVDIFKWFWTRQ